MVLIDLSKYKNLKLPYTNMDAEIAFTACNTLLSTSKLKNTIRENTPAISDIAKTFFKPLIARAILCRGCVIAIALVPKSKYINSVEYDPIALPNNSKI